MKPGYFLFVDHDKYEWDKPSITGAELRTLAAIPQGAEMFLKVPGRPEKPIDDTDTVDLKDLNGPAMFSTQSPGSQAG